ncbi:hypothetical protein OVA11_14045 [Caulobacter sp. SL161]|uniref:hypothetical protein n=1 Tax=Caulobacter sp. SL161 TaxID=2995156 RepID=UPI0022723865|nr:hypothetical protein [Caulobacter sp. SL161]MCY1648141.1 hypothetical protein [Caulobacter sp. SL161]
MKRLVSISSALLVAIPSLSVAGQSSQPTAADSDRQSAQMAELFAGQPSAPSSAPSAPVETGYTPLVKAWLNNYLRDPYSAVITEVRGPRQTSFKSDVWTKINGTAVCYDINAKNAYGGFTGVKRHLFVFEYGRVAYHISTGDARENSLAPMLVSSECDRPAGG